jgi:hypothetical protein
MEEGALASIVYFYPGAGGSHAVKKMCQPAWRYSWLLLSDGSEIMR